MKPKAVTLFIGILITVLLTNALSGDIMSISSGEGLRGSEGHSITVALKNDSSIVGILLYVVYDPTVFAVIDVAQTLRTEQFDLFFWNTAQPGRTGILMAFTTVNDLQPDSGAIAEVTFDILNSALPGTYSLTLEGVQLTDTTVTLLPVDIFNGQFEVSVVLDSLRIFPKMAEVACAQTQIFIATGYDAVGPPIPLDVDWSFSPEPIGSVDPTGRFTANHLGSGSLKATFQTWTDSASVTVIPGEPITLDIQPDSAVVASGAQQQYTATGLDTCDNLLIPDVAWVVHPQSLGSIDETGLFTAFTVGSGWIIASNNPSDSAFVTVTTGSVMTINVSPDSSTISCADTLRFSAIGYDAGENPIHVEPDWTVRPDSLGTITPEGHFTAEKSGQGWIMAMTDEIIDSAYIHVEAGSLSTLNVQPDSLSLLSGQSHRFTVTAYDACGNALLASAEWSVSPSYLGTIDSEGLFTARIEGQGWIFATGSATDSAYLQVQRGPATALTLFPSDTTIVSGDTIAYIAKATDGYNIWDVSVLTGISTTDPTGLASENRYIAGSTGTWLIVGTYTFDTTTISDTASVTVISSWVCERGDVNCDNSITPGDALCAFWRSILGSFQQECFCPCSDESADINCDGQITPGDALCVFWRAIQEEWPPECDCLPLEKALPGDGAASHVEVGSVSGKPNDIIRVPILVDQPQGFDAFGLELRYPDAQLVFRSLSASALTNEWTLLDGVNLEPGVIRIGGFHTKALNASEPTPIAEVVFTVREGAQGGGAFELTNLTDDAAGIPVIGGRFTVTIRPTDYALRPNYPNPFNPTTDIGYQIADGRYPIHATLKIYNILGQEVRTVVDEIQEAGYYSVTWDGRDYLGQEVTSGIYFYRLTAGDFTATRQMVLLK